MGNRLMKLIDEQLKLHSSKKRWISLVAALGVVVVLSTVYALILPARTIETAVFCGMDEHTAHTGACYDERILPLSELLVTVSDGDVFAVREADYVLVCTQDSAEHVHDGSCCISGADFAAKTEEYSSAVISTDSGDAVIEIVQECGSLHEHSLQCYSDPQADLETRESWERTIAALDLSGSNADNLVAVAKSQLGYRESENNYLVGEDGSKKGYTRYGEWCGEAYCSWNNSFASFCLSYAGIDIYAPVGGKNCQSWVYALDESGMLADVSDGLLPGDLLFSDSNFDGLADRVCIVYSCSDNEVKVIEGDHNDSVSFASYAMTDESLVYCGAIAERQSNNINSVSATDAVSASDTAFETQPVYESGVLKVKGADYAVTLSYGSDAQIPLSAALSVREIEQDSEEYKYYATSTAAAVSSENSEKLLSFARFFDIRILVDGKEIEPCAPVSVSIRYSDNVNLPQGDAHAIHFEDEGDVELLELNDSNESDTQSAHVSDADAGMQAADGNTFSFEGNSFSVYGTIIEREYRSGFVSAKWATMRKASVLNAAKNDIVYQTNVTVSSSRTYSISTKTADGSGTAIPVIDSAGNSDGISLAGPEFTVTASDGSAAVALDGNLYCITGYSGRINVYSDSALTQVAYFRIDDNENLVPYAADGTQLTGELVLVTEEEKVRASWGVKALSAVIDQTGEGTDGAILYYDVIGDEDDGTTMGDTFTMEYSGYAGDVMRISDYIPGTQFFYRTNAGELIGVDAGFVEHSAYPLTECKFVKLIDKGNNAYTIRPCDRNGNDIANAATFVITDRQYRFAFTVNEMVKEHAEDDGKAYFWAGTQYYLYNSENNNQTRASADYAGTDGGTHRIQQWAADDPGNANATENYYTAGRTIRRAVELTAEADAQFKSDVKNLFTLNRLGNDPYIRGNRKFFTTGDNSPAATQVVQKTYYITGRVGDALLASQAVSQNTNPDTPADGFELKTILYAATGSQTTAVDVASWDSSWRGLHDNSLPGADGSAGAGNLGRESYIGWHTGWINLAAHASEGGDRYCIYSIRDYLVLDSSWDKIVNFIITEDGGETKLCAQKFDDPTLYPFVSKYSETHANPDGDRQSDTVIGYGSGSTAIELYIPRQGLIKEMMYDQMLNVSNLHNDYKPDHLQMRLNTNIITQLNGTSYQGTFEFVSGEVSILFNSDPYKLRTDSRYYIDVILQQDLKKFEGDDCNEENWQKMLDERKFVTLTRSNAQESTDFKWTIFRPDGTDDNGNIKALTSDYVNVVCRYTISGVLKPLVNGAVSQDPSTWIVYSTGNNGALSNDLKADISAASGAGAQTVDAMQHTIELTDDQLEEAFFACPNSKGYDVIVDANVAFLTDAQTSSAIRIRKEWDDGVFSSLRPASVTVTIERSKDDGATWEDDGTVTLTGSDAEVCWFEDYMTESGYIYRIKPGSEVMEFEDGQSIKPTYTGTIDGNVLRNKLNLSTKAFGGTKQWLYPSGAAMGTADIPDSIVLSLYQNTSDENLGLQFSTQTVLKPSSGEWAWSFADLPKYYLTQNGDAGEYVYTVAEIQVTEGTENVVGDYSPVFSQNGNGQYVFTNRHKPVLKLLKTGKNGDDSAPLAGAQFTLTGNGTTYHLVSGEDGYLRDRDSGETEFTLEFDTTYTLTEIAAPDGYNNVAPITFRYDSLPAQWKVPESLDYSDSGSVTTFTVVNTPGYKLPESGTSDNIIYTANALILTAVAAYGLILDKKRRAAQ